MGYAGRISAGIFSFNGQGHWTHTGGAQYSESRTFFGVGLPRDPCVEQFHDSLRPQLTFQPNRYWSVPWFKEIDVMALYLQASMNRHRADCRSSAVAGIS